MLRKLQRAIPGFRAVYAFEPQDRGAWHVHACIDRLPPWLIVRESGSGRSTRVRSWDYVRRLWRDVVGADSWHESGHKGRTMYVGKLKHGKTLCVYEKGRQLGMPDSDWTRFEVRLGNRDRVIPLSVLTNPDEAFVGAYPALRDLLEAAALEIPTQREETKGTLAHALYHMRRCFGAHAHQAMEATGCTAGDLIEEVRVHRMPRKLDPSGVVAGLAWPELQAQMERLKT